MNLLFRIKIKLANIGLINDPRKFIDQDSLYVIESVQPVKTSISQEKVDRNLFVDQNRIHFIGNSHAHSFTGSRLSKYGIGDQSHPFWDSISLGPMSSIDFITIKWPLFQKLIDKNLIRSGDVILLTFGEAEARWYALKQREVSSETVKFSSEEMTRLLQPFIDAALEAYDRLINMGFNVIAWSGHPSSRSDPHDDPDMPVFGTPENRNNLLLEWAKQIEIGAKTRNIPFVSILDITLDENNQTIEYFLEDVCHLKPSILEGITFSKFNEIGIPLSRFEKTSSP